GMIEEWLETTGQFKPNRTVCIKMICDEVFNDEGKLTKKDRNDIANILDNNIVNWMRLENNHRFTDYGSQRAWQLVLEEPRDDDIPF
ncbi:MAG: hypothetical protein HUJ63_12190, partial [Enterococcus sp.]|nr:hypothetical protein [Enterococcus sp.]